MVRKPRRTSVVVAMLTLAGCAPFSGLTARPVVREARVPAPAPRRTDFTAVLLPSLDPAGAADTARPSGTLRISWRQDLTLEYDLRIVDAHGVSFTSAQLLRRVPGREPETVATLFTDMRLTGPIAQMRGTGSVVRGVGAEVLADEIRGQPSAFLVRVTCATDSSAVLQGTFR